MYKRFPKERSQENERQNAFREGPEGGLSGEGPPRQSRLVPSLPLHIAPTLPATPASPPHVPWQSSWSSGTGYAAKRGMGEAAVSRSAHKRPTPGILTGLFSRIQGLFYPVSFYGESHERRWKGTERSVKKQPTVAGHSGKLEMKVKSLPRFMQKPERATRTTHLFSSLKLILLVGVSFFCSQQPCRKCRFLVLSLEGKMQRLQLNTIGGDSRERVTLQRAVVCERNIQIWTNDPAPGKDAKPRDLRLCSNHVPSRWSLGPCSMPASISELLAD